MPGQAETISPSDSHHSRVGRPSINQQNNVEHQRQLEMQKSSRLEFWSLFDRQPSLIQSPPSPDSGVCTKASLTSREEDQCTCHQYTPRPVGPWSACLVTKPLPMSPSPSSVNLNLITHVNMNIKNIFTDFIFRSNLPLLRWKEVGGVCS